MGRARQALQLKFPPSQEIPIPPDLSDALKFINTTVEQDSMSFWWNRISMLERPAKKFHPITDEWYSLMPSQLGNLNSVLHLVLVAYFLQFYGCVGNRWILHYIFGSPLIGWIAYPSVFPDKGPKIATTAPSEDIREGAAGRFPTGRSAVSHLPTSYGRKQCPMSNQDGLMNLVG